MRHGKERRKMRKGGREEWSHTHRERRKGGEGKRERDGKGGRRDKKHSQTNLKLVDVWGCEETR